jgi:hypothetical protein
MRFSNFLNKALMGKQIMHSARALFLTFLALEKSKRNSTFYEDYAAAEKLCRSSASRKVGTRSAAELRLFRSGAGPMLLHAQEIRFVYPVSHEFITIQAELSAEFKRTLALFLME